MVLERSASRQLVIGIEPVIQQDSSGVGNSLVPASNPSLDCLAECRDAWRSAQLRGYVEKVCLRVAGSDTFLARQVYFTCKSRVLVVSLPRISMTFTTTLYEPDASYSYLVESSIFDSCRVRYDCH